MKRGSPFVLCAVFFAAKASYSQDQSKMIEAIQILRQTPSGIELIEQAKVAWNLERHEDIIKFFQWGNSSRTDAVLMRHFNPKTGVEQRERKITIFLRSGQHVEELVLDIAHELVHASARPSWDPYDPQLTPGRYIVSAIEGHGGEVDAMMAECKVSLELMDRLGAFAKRCQGYLKTGMFSIEREKIRKEFYRTGKWTEDLIVKLGEEARLMPLLSPETPTLYSSTGQAPYPVALFTEFQEINAAACRNSNRRLASVSQAVQQPINDFIKRRCTSE